MTATPPYYTLGQWRLPSRRLLRAFVAGADGGVYFACMPFDPVELTPDEAHYCDTRVVPRLLQQLEEFDREHPDVLTSPVVLAQLRVPAHERSRQKAWGQDPNGRSVWARVARAPAAAESASGGLLGTVLLEEKIITAPQLTEALSLQATSATYLPLGQVLVAMKLVTRKELMALLQRHKKRSRLGQILIKAGCLTSAQLEEALAQQQGKGLRIGEALVQLGHVSEAAMRDALCTQLHVNFFDLDLITIDPSLAGLLPEPFATRHLVVPLFRTEKILVLAMNDPSNAALLEEIEASLRVHVEVVTSTTAKLQAALHRLYGRSPQPEVGEESWRRILVGAVRDPFVLDLAARALGGVSQRPPDMDGATT